MKRFNIGRRLGLAAVALGALIAVWSPQSADAARGGGGGGFHAGAGVHVGGFAGGFRGGFAGRVGGPGHWDHRGWGGAVVLPYDGLDDGDWAGQYVYYCQDPAGYYPDVTQCATGWQTVPSD